MAMRANSADMDAIIDVLTNMRLKLPFDIENPLIGSADWHAREDRETASGNITFTLQMCQEMMQKNGSIGIIVKTLAALKKAYPFA